MLAAAAAVTAVAVVGAALAIFASPRDPARVMPPPPLAVHPGSAVHVMLAPPPTAGSPTAVSPGLRAVAVVGAVAFLLGVLLLAYGLWRARAVQPWMAGGIAAAAIVVVIGQVTDNRLIFAIAFAIYLVALGPIGWTILTESVEEWARDPAGPANTPAQDIG